MVYKIIQEIASTRSRNEKEAFLKREVNNKELKEFFRLALNPFINFYQKKKFVQGSTGDTPLSDAMLVMERDIAGRKFTGNAAVEVINLMLDIISADDAKVIMHILKKESGCDLGGATINKIWPKLIPTFPTLLATAYTEKLGQALNWAAGVMIQLKSDGLRINLVIDYDGSVKAYSRAGNELNFFGVFDFLGHSFPGYVIDGELLTIDVNGKFNNRQTSNGICSKAIKGTMSQDEANTLHIASWDLIPLEDFKNEKSEVRYHDRYTYLASILNHLENNDSHKKISLIETKTVHSIEEAQEIHDRYIAAGEEGSMWKDVDMPWGDTRSKQQLKVKSEHTGDFEVIGYKDGVGKLTGNLGSLIIATSDRKLVSNMSGFSLKLRSEIWANIQNKPIPYYMVIGNENVLFEANPGDCDVYIGTIIEAMYNCKIKARDTDIWSIFLPRFKQTRYDKTQANTIEELK